MSQLSSNVINSFTHETIYNFFIPELPESDVGVAAPEEIVLTLSKDQRELLETIPALFQQSDMAQALTALAQYMIDSEKAGVLDRGLLEEAAEL